MRRLRVAAAQVNVRVGDLEGNLALLLDAYERAAGAGADLVAFPELAICGYPPEDLLLKPAFVAEAMDATAKLAANVTSTVAIVGCPSLDHDLYNAAAVCAEGRIVGLYRKQLLPNYAVFDEQRYFVPGSDAGPLYEIGGVRVGVTICEDVWSPTGPLADQAAGGAELAVNINGSPYHRGKLGERQMMLATRAADAGIPLLYCNLVGGQDELVFDGASVLFDGQGRIVARSSQFVEDLLVVDVEVPPPYRERLFASRGRRHDTPMPAVSISTAVDWPSTDRSPVEAALVPALEDLAEVWSALVLGTRDYVRKNGFSDVVIGLSGGVDSSLVAALAADALGPEHVHGVSMPSRYSSEGSIDDAAALAANLGIDHRTIAIEAAHGAFGQMLAPSFEGRQPGLTEENLQSRIRGVLLMALSNEFGWLVLTTGNKSELAVGYSTLYGDTAGGFAVLKDVPKLAVYDLCRHRNAGAGGPVIPEAVLTKPPSAELRPDQRDDQSLPPYTELDPVLAAYIEEDRTADELVDMGFDADLVRRVTRLVDLAEYKRRQNPIGPRISAKAFGKDRRLPIVNAYR
jgi:NAD+ synthase (glutamine-hydrolysing)